MKKHQYLYLAILSGILLTAAWPTYGFAPLLFIAFIPLLFIEKKLVQYTNNGSWLILKYSFICFIIFNIITTWWICNSSVIAGILACLLNTIFMVICFQLYHFIRVAVFGKNNGQWILAAFWISFEKLHLTWELNWPWLNLGNAFATYSPIIQWYSITGILGGTLWVIIVNILLFKAIDYYLKNKNVKQLINNCIAPTLLIIIPIIISLIQYYTYKEKGDPVNVVVYQPNSDPWGEEFELTSDEVIDRFKQKTINLIDDKTDFIICPESMMQEQVFEQHILQTNYIKHYREYLKDNAPNSGLIIGASTYKTYDKTEKISHTARKINNTEQYYDAYNTTIYIDTTDILQIHHKSKLTPGVEIMPFIKYLPFINNLALDLGGTVGSLGTDSIQLPFYSKKSQAKPASIICYESIFGEHVNKFINNNANIIFISTNDGWWKDTQGYRQHCSYARLLAISTRRDIARSANTGTSCVINQRGDIYHKTKYWTVDAFKATINLNDKKTFYVKNGDYISHIAIVILITITMIAVINRIVTITKIKS